MTDSKCPDRTLLVGYALGTISEGEAEIVAEHLETCVLCDATVEQIESQGDSVIRNLRQPPSPESEIESPECQAALAQAEGIVASRSAMAGLQKEVMGEGRILGQYQLLDKLGQGGMGAVYKARHLKLKRFVAIKVLPQARMNDVRAVARFEREMEAVGRLDHPHIVRAHDACEIDGTHFLVMEYVDGIDLSAVVDRLGPLSIADACEIVRQAALGLQYVHEHNLVHRDVKPSNLILTADGRVKVLDLGLALLSSPETDKDKLASAGQAMGAADGMAPEKPPDSHSKGELTSADQAMGTADYMAPEQTTDSHSVDIRADIYSLGCTLYKLLTGRAPFADRRYRTALQKMMAHVNEPVPPVQSLCSEVRPELAAILQRMLAKQPQVRYAVPRELAAALAPWTAGADLKHLHLRAAGSDPFDMAMPAGSVHQSVRTVAPALAPLAASRTPRRYLPWIIGIVALAVLGGGIWAATVIVRLKDKQGRVVAEITAPEGTTAEVVRAETVPSIPAAGAPAAAGTPSPPTEATEPFSPRALVQSPARIAGLRRWTIETAGPRGPVTSVGYSADGSLLAVGSWDGMVRVWDVASGRLLTAIAPGPESVVITLAWSPRGRLLALGSSGQIWDCGSRQTRKIQQLGWRALRYSWSPDGKQMAMAGATDHPVIWSTERTEYREFNVGLLDYAVWSPDGRHIALAGKQELRLWDVQSRAASKPFGYTVSETTGVSWSPDGRRIAWSDDGRGHSGQVVILDVETGQRLATLSGGGAHCRGVVWSPDGKLVAAGSMNEDLVRVWDAASGQLVFRSNASRGGSALAFSPDNQTLTAGDRFGSLYSFQVGTWAQKIQHIGYGWRNMRLAASPDGQFLASANQTPQGGARIWKTESGEGVGLFPTKGSASRVAWGADGQSLAIGEFIPDGASLWSVASGRIVARLDDVKGEWGLAFSPDGSRIAAAGGPDQLWDVRSQQRIDLLSGCYLSGMAFSGDGRLLAIGQFKGGIAICDAATGQTKRILDLPFKCRAVAWSPDSVHLAAMDDAGQLVAWETTSGRSVLQAMAPVQPYGMPSVGWCDAKTVWAGSGAGLCLVDLTSSKISKTISGAAIYEACLAGRYAFFADIGAIRARSVDSGQLCYTILPLRDREYAVIGPEGHLRISSEAAKKELVYVADTDEGVEVLSPDAFAAKYRWQNIPAKASPALPVARALPANRLGGAKAAPSGAGVDQPPRVSGDRKVGNVSQGRFSEGNKEAPPLAIAPFNASEARKHQEAWAKHLGKPLEMVNSIGMKFSLISPGEFPMGATPEELVWAVQKGRENNEQPWFFDLASSATPRHRVAIRQPFYLAVFEATQAEYQKVTGKSPSSLVGTSKLSPPRSERTVKVQPSHAARVSGADTHRNPVETVSWEEAAEFCRRLSALPEEQSARRVYRLPTEAQWEYACRAGSCGKWNVGDQEESLADAAWFRKTSDWTTHPVGLKRPNAWGLHDMHGNVSEWCEDWFDLKYYAHSPATDPPGASTGSQRVVRGGSWVNSSFHCRSATRYSFPPAIRQHETGFRVLCEIPEARGASRETNNRQ